MKDEGNLCQILVRLEVNTEYYLSVSFPKVFLL